MQNADIYLDYAAASPVDLRVATAMQPFFSDSFHNPSATYSKGLAARQALDLARTQVASRLGCRGSEITFTAGGTESDNLAIHGVMQQFSGATIVTSAIEHDAVLAPAANYDHRIAPVDAHGLIDMSALEALIDDNTVLVSIMYANNEIGTIEPLAKIAAMLRAKRAQRTSNLPLYFHSDACQAAGYLDLNVARLGVDMLTINGGKIYGPKQSGALFVRGGISLEPLIYGGGQEHGLRSGTENIAASVGLATALDLVQANRHDEVRRLQALQQQFLEGITDRLPQVIINGSRKSRLPNNIHMTIPGVDNERLLIQLDEKGIMAAAGSACSASNEEPSHVLRAIGLSDQQAQSSIRLTMGQSTTAAAMTTVLTTLVQLVS